MICPFCREKDTSVVDSRPTEDGAAIRRRRLCPACGARVPSFERVQLRDLTVIKKFSNKVKYTLSLKYFLLDFILIPIPL